MAETGFVTLVCGTCGRTRQMFADQWEKFKKRRSESGTVVLCEQPSTVPKSKSKCLGVLLEASEAPWYKPEKK